ncbi:MAG TPA: DNA-binding transcriptional regulator [Bacteroidia bacterium]|nr:DNA-binding transcriptional regulator [Bacteroidia bacterium]
MPSARKRIALLVETSLGSGREILRGIARYARQAGDWRLYHAAGGLPEAFPEWMESWEGDGVLARIQNAETLERLDALGLPVVDVLGLCESRFPLVHVDDDAIARLVAEHLQSLGFVHFAFYGIAGENWSERRGRSFHEACRGAGTFHRLETPRRRLRPQDDRAARLQEWLRGLPKPVGVMVCSDQRGLELLEACLSEDLSVPEQVAVIGVDNDTALCEISEPPLSSVRGGHFRVGYEAAHLLDSILDGAPPPGSPLLVPPHGLVERDSSNQRAIADPLVAKGVRHIREHLAEAITNDSISRAAGLSRTLFQRRFREATGQSVREFILARRLERAISLIGSTDIPLAEVAERCGFRHQEYLGQVVKQATGETPGAIRRRSRDSQSA